MKKLLCVMLLFLSAIGALAQNGTDSGNPEVIREVIRKSRFKHVYVASGEYSRWGLSTNLTDWALFGTLNMEAQFSVAQHFTIDALAKYNNWTFGNDSEETRSRYAQRTFAVGVRYWPWYVYSGWWFGARGQYRQYSHGNVFGIDHKEEGDAYGLGLSAGYSIQVASWFNIDLGIGAWGGIKDYSRWEQKGVGCPTCGRLTESGRKFFILPDDVQVSLMFIF